MSSKNGAALFWSFVEDGISERLCWPWKGPLSTSSDGPVFHNAGSSEPARRVAYELTFGAPPFRYRCYAACGSDVCVNPHHLRIVRIRNNVCIGRPRSLSPEDRRAIVTSINRNRQPVVDVAREYGVSESTIYRALRLADEEILTVPAEFREVTDKSLHVPEVEVGQVWRNTLAANRFVFVNSTRNRGKSAQFWSYDGWPLIGDRNRLKGAEWIDIDDHFYETYYLMPEVKA